MASSVRRLSSLKPVFESPILEVSLREDIWVFNAPETLEAENAEPASAVAASDPVLADGLAPQNNTAWVLSTGDFFQDWSNAALITANDDWSAVPAIVGYLGQDITTGQGTDPQTLTTDSLLANDVDVIANQLTPNTNNTGGVAEFTGANVGNNNVVALQGSGTADAPHLVVSLDATGRQNLTVSYVLRDIDGAVDNAVQPVALQYRIGNSGAWTNVPAGFVADATTGPSLATLTTNVSALLPAAVNNQALVQIRIITTNAVGSDEWVGVDDIRVQSTVIAGNPGTLDIADASVVEGNGGGPAPVISFTVTRSGGATGAVSATWTATFAGSASTSDFLPLEPLTGTVNFANGETSKTITMQIQSDLTPEPDETFTITLSAPTGGAALNDAVATGTILDDDTPRVTINDVSIAEGNAGTSLLTFTVTRTGGTGAFDVDFATGGGTATAVSDYLSNSGTLNFGAGENSKTIQVTINGDTTPEPNETFNVTLSNPTNSAVITDATGVGTILNDELLFIHDIQGTAYFSPILAGDGITAFNTASITTVTIRAVVTAVDGVGTRQGFYLTEEFADWDANAFTSEGIFVMTRNDANVGSVVSGVAVGDIVTVTAQVMEYQAFSSMPRTVLVNSSISVQSSGNALPTFTITSTPNSIMTGVTPDYTDSSDGAGDSFDASNYALSFWETVEGMLVTIPNMVVADGFVQTSGGRPYLQAYSTNLADASQINSRGGYTIGGDPANSPPDTADPDDGTTQGGRHIHDGDVNPDIIEVDFSDFAVAPPANLLTNATMGDLLGDLTGIVDFDFTDRKLFVTNVGGTGFVDNGQPVQETTTFGSDVRSLTIATFNVENLGGNALQSRFDNIALAIKNNLQAPDILCVEEIQDNNGTTNDGTTDASITWQKLVDALNLATGKTYQWVDQAPTNNAEGGAPGGNIRVGFLYDTARVTLGDLAANATLAQRREFTDRIGDGVRDAGDRITFDDSMVGGEIVTTDWTTTRKSLLGEFSFNGNKVFVVANHWPSKGGSGQFWQLNQDISAGNPTNSDWAQRNAVAQDVYSIMNLIQTVAPTAGIVAGGDFNEFYFNRPLEVLTGYVTTDGAARVGGSRFDNLTVTKLTEAERYTYTFDGRSQAIDHVIANGRMSAVAGYDVVHLNTGYNANGVNPRLSDHDPAVASFNFRSYDETLTGTNGDDAIDLSQGGNDTVNSGDGNDGLYFGAAFTAADRVDGGAGTNDQIGLQGDYTGPNALTLGVNTITGVEVIALLNGFSYDITTVQQNVAPGQLLTFHATALGESNNFTFNGSAETDGGRFIVYGGFGSENLTGGSGDDGFYFGQGRYGPSDVVNGGAGANDQLGLDGSYGTLFQPLVLSGARISGIEVIALLQKPGAATNNYFLASDEALVANGQTLTIWGAPLEGSLFFLGSAETDGGAFRIFGGTTVDALVGGGAADWFHGGLGGDSMDGGGGADIFAYTAANHSTGVNFDRLVNFDDNVDKIDLPGTVAGFAAPGSGTLSLATFDADLAAGVNAALGSNQAILFTASGGDMNGRIFGVVDVNGDGDYQSGTDYVFEFVTPATPIDQLTIFV